MTATFHVVRHYFDDVLTTYSIFQNDQPYLKPPRGKRLGRRAAYQIARLLNAVVPAL